MTIFSASRRRALVVATAFSLAALPTYVQAAGIYEGFPAPSTEILGTMSGSERFAIDTLQPQGAPPQTVNTTIDSLYAGTSTDDSDATAPNLTAAEVSGAPLMYVRFTGAPTTNQAATLPLVADVWTRIAPQYGYSATAVAGKCWFVKFVNVGGTSSGTFTITTNTGWGTLNGNMVVPVAGSRTVKMCMTSSTAGTVSDYGN